MEKITPFTCNRQEKCNMEYPNCKILFCTYFAQKKAFQFEYETYDKYTMFCMRNGSISYHIDADEPHELHAGQLVICPPNKSFHRKTITPSDICMIQFDADVPDAICEKPFIVQNITRFNDNLDSLMDSCFCCDFELHQSTKHYCHDIWYQIISQHIGTSSPPDEAIQYIKSNFTSDICIAELALKNGYSTGGFISCFKKNYRCTPLKYISTLRINYAKQLLSGTTMSISNIANACGYEDPLYFSKQFHKYTSQSPKDFRKATEKQRDAIPE